MAKVKILKTYMANGEIKKSQFTSTIKDVKKYFDNAIEDAEVLAKAKKGKVKIEREKGVLYINYVDVPNDSVIDVIRIVQ